LEAVEVEVVPLLTVVKVRVVPAEAVVLEGEYL
jgi:hypothetical protein